MHIVDNKLVGTIVSDVYSENGSVIIVLSDGDTTPVREMQTYSYIQTKELAEIGIAVNPKGVVTIPGYTLEEFNNGLDPNLYAITVKYNGELYQIGVADFLELTAGEAVDYVPYVADTYPGQTTGAVIPPFSEENAGQVVSVDEETGKLKWRDVPSGLPAIASGDAGKVLKVKEDESGAEWGSEGGGQSGGKSNINVELYVTSGTIESVYIDGEEATLEDLFDYGWENVSKIRISADGINSEGTFLLQAILPTPSVVRVAFGVLSIPAVIPDSNGYAYIKYVTVESTGGYTKAYDGSITIRKMS